MSIEELTRRYRALRQALHEAYDAPVWDSARIDHIAQAMLPLERALAQHGAGRVPPPAEGAGGAGRWSRGPSAAGWV